MERAASRPAGTRPAPQNSILLKAKDPAWPTLWNEMNDPPAEVHVSGDPEVLCTPAIGIVGTRRASPRGLAIARGLACGLAQLGWTIVSGLAKGVDGAAHQGALDAGGRTVAVMATGCDLTYPAVHCGLRSKLETRGCSLTEFATGVGPRKYHFPRRNRLIAGLVTGLIVVEAPLRSGALLTAFLALDYNREVFAVPGPIDSSTSAGCHRLLREGAHLLERPDDVTRILGLPQDGNAGLPMLSSESSAKVASDPDPGTPAAWILDRIDLEGVSRDELRRRWPGNEDSWQKGLLALELSGSIRRLPGGRLARTIWRP